MTLAEKSERAKQEMRAYASSDLVLSTKKIAVDENGNCIIVKNENQVSGAYELHVFKVRYDSGRITSELLN